MSSGFIYHTVIAHSVPGGGFDDSSALPLLILSKLFLAWTGTPRSLLVERFFWTVLEIPGERIGMSKKCSSSKCSESVAYSIAFVDILDGLSCELLLGLPISFPYIIHFVCTFVKLKVY